VRQSTLDTFGRIGKAGNSKQAGPVGKKDLIEPARETTCLPPGSSSIKNPLRGKHSLDNSDSDGKEVDNNFTTNPSVKRQKLDLDEERHAVVTKPETPRKQRLNPQLLPTPESTPTKSTKVIFQDSSGTPSKGTLIRNSPLLTPPSSPSIVHNGSCPAFKGAGDLPDELEELIDLHSSLMKALSIHLAHFGIASPVNVATLLPIVTKIWKTRNVTLDDIRRIIGFTECPASQKNKHSKLVELRMHDYSQGKICIEWPESQTRLSWQNTTEKLNKHFVDILEDRWSSYRPLKVDNDPEQILQSFIDALPLARIPLAPSLKKTAPMFANGQRRLDEFHILARDAQAQAKNPTIKASHFQSSSKPDPKSRASSLLDRLMAKKATSLNSDTPTKQDLERRAALYRLPELVAILSTLRRSASQQRQSHTLQSLIKDVQNSARSPMSREEVETSVRLLADEIAVEGVRIIDTGAAMGKSCAGKGITAVVLDWSTIGDLAGRVRRAVNALDAAVAPA